jgi:hypothetical protein
MKFKYSIVLLPAALFTLYVSNYACGVADRSAASTIRDTIPFNALPVSRVTIDADAQDTYVNVMGDSMPSGLPSFPKLSKKANKVCGYVKNRWGQPLMNAYIGIRSSVVGGLYSAASAQTDSKGYYEISLPTGAVHFFAAGYPAKYGPGLAALGLYPADGDAESFASAAGAVENFVLLPYGYGNLAAISDKPWYGRNYFGGNINISYTIKEDMWSSAGSLPADATIEITLTPEGFLLDATEKRIFTIRKKVGLNNFGINNIPIGKYKIEARLSNGKTLKLKMTGFWQHALYGMRPKEAMGSAIVLFTPHSADTKACVPNLGSFTETGIKLEMP